MNFRVYITQSFNSFADLRSLATIRQCFIICFRKLDIYLKLKLLV